MTWNNTWWKHALYMAGLTLASNLILRVIFWSDKPLLSWNVPISLAIGFLVGWLLWPVQRRFLAQRQEWQELEDDLERAMADWEELKNHKYGQTMGRIDDFLKHPETGVHRDRPARRTETKDVHDTEGSL